MSVSSRLKALAVVRRGVQLLLRQLRAQGRPEELAMAKAQVARMVLELKADKAPAGTLAQELARVDRAREAAINPGMKPAPGPIPPCRNT